MQANRKLAIMQPYFLPYLGYFQLMAKVDAFVLYDDVHFINRGWINRNRININGRAHLLTVPLQHSSQNRLICEIDTSNDAWREKILKTIQQAYARASQFSRVFPLIERIVLYPTSNLADYLHHSLIALRDHFELQTNIVATSRRYQNSRLKGQERIIDICLREKATQYINSIGGVDLYDHSRFDESDLRLSFLTPALPPHADTRSQFVPGLSIVDVLMHNDATSMQEKLYAGVLS